MSLASLAAKALAKSATRKGGKVAQKATPEPSLAVPAKKTPAAPAIIKKRSAAPSLLAAVKAGGKTYTGKTHLDAIAAIPDAAARKAAALDANSKGFVNERGRFLDRYKAADYARNFDLFSPGAPSWARTAPEVISENLKLPADFASDLTVSAAQKAAPEKSLAAKRTRAAKAPAKKVPAAPINPATLIDREYGPAMARRVAEYVDSNAPVAEWRATAERFADAGNPNYAEPRPSAYKVRPAEVATDPRIETRKKEQQKIRDLELEIQPRALEEPPTESIYDLEGRGLLTTMSDLSAAGDDVLAVNNVRLQRPFSRQGGQGFMFENPGEVWAADKANAAAIQKAAAEIERQTGKPAIIAPFTMGPLSSMFSHHPRGLQYAYADAALDAPEKAMLAESIRGILPDWTDFSDPEAYMTFMRAAGKRRGQLNKLMDQFRDRGGLGRGEAVYGTTDLDQLGAPMLALRNLGEVDTRFGLSESKNPAYSTGVPGQGRAKLKEENLGALSLFPELMEQYGYQTPFDFPVGVNKGVASPLRAFQLKPQPTIITDKVLRFLDDLRVQGRDRQP